MNKQRTFQTLPLGALALALTLALGGCSLAPTLHTPEAPIPRQWAGNVPTAAASAAVDWQDFVTDPTVRKLVEQALHNNR
ncbi:MAG: multidrug transporter, partial [Comamonas sp.]|nr:multidrug transporter [Comamonas sp.]